MNKVLEAPLHEDLRALVQAARQAGWQVWVSEEGGHQVLWADSDSAAQWLLSQYPGLRDQTWRATSVPLGEPAASASWLAAGARWPVTLGVLLASVVVSLGFFWLGDVRVAQWLAFEPMQIDARGIRAWLGVEQGLQQGQVWRLFTPVLLHFSWLHLVFNGLWLWELGRRLELRRGSLYLLIVILLTGVISNSAQYAVGRWLQEPALFGGLSGVIYALIGYIAVWNRLNPGQRYPVPPGLFPFMMVWLVLCLLRVPALLGLGEVANSAHVAGLLSGLLVGAWAVWRSRRGY